MPKFQKSSRNFLKGPSMYSSPAKNYSIEKGSHSHPHAPAPTKYASPTKNDKTKEQLMKEGFSQVEADQMIKNGATTGKTKVKTKVKKEDKPMDQSKVDQSKIVNEEGFTQAEMDKMTEKQKEGNIDGYVPKKSKDSKSKTKTKTK